MIVQLGTEEQIRHPNNAIHGRADLVAHGRQKITFYFDRRYRSVPSMTQFILDPFEGGQVDERGHGYDGRVGQRRDAGDLDPRIRPIRANNPHDLRRNQCFGPGAHHRRMVLARPRTAIFVNAAPLLVQRAFPRELISSESKNLLRCLVMFEDATLFVLDDDALSNGCEQRPVTVLALSKLLNGGHLGGDIDLNTKEI